jgi:hypothetical protein
LFGAHRAEQFAREERLRPLSHYLRQGKPAAEKTKQTPAERLTAFQALAARGSPIKIELVP